jgi:hypothetical protein
MIGEDGNFDGSWKMHQLKIWIQMDFSQFQGLVLNVHSFKPSDGGSGFRVYLIDGENDT